MKFRHLLLTFLAVFVLTTVSLVIVTFTQTFTIDIVIPALVVVGAGVVLVRLAYRFPDLPGIWRNAGGTIWTISLHVWTNSSVEPSIFTAPAGGFDDLGEHVRPEAVLVGVAAAGSCKRLG